MKERACKVVLSCLCFGRIFAFGGLDLWRRLGPKDQPQRLVVSEVVPNPIDKNKDLILDTKDGKEVNDHPDKPGKKTLKLETKP